MSSLQAIVFAHLIQATIVVLCTLVIVRLSYKRFPHLAFLVCMLALAKCLVPPLVTSPTGVFTRLSSVSFAPPATEFSTLDLPSLSAKMNTSTAFVGAAATEAGVSGFTMAQLLIAIWAIGVLALVCVTGNRLIRVQRIIGRALPARREFRELMEQLKAELGIRREVRLLISGENFGPACVGALRPTLIVPRSMVDSWPERLLCPVIAHELVHVRRGDVLWGYLQYTVQVCFWFHPLVWWIGRQAQLLCERCCDNEAIASLRCSPADYGESLVRVLELRTVCRRLPLAHAMSPVEITSQRLTQLATSEYSARSTRIAWGLTLLLATLTLPGMKWSSAIEMQARKNEEMRLYKEQINCAICMEDWELAARLLQPVVAEEPDNPDAVFFLAYTLHQSGRLDEAIVFHRRAAEFSSVKPLAIYNLACALALKGDSESAMQTLATAVSAGFRPQTSLRDDADLISLFSRADFRALDANVNEPGMLAKLCDVIATGLATSREVEQIIVASSGNIGLPSGNSREASRAIHYGKAIHIESVSDGQQRPRGKVIVRADSLQRSQRNPVAHEPLKN